MQTAGVAAGPGCGPATASGAVELPIEEDGSHYCRGVSRLPYLRRDELDHAGQEVWDSIVGSRGATLVNEQGGAWKARSRHSSSSSGSTRRVRSRRLRTVRAVDSNWSGLRLSGVMPGTLPSPAGGLCPAAWSCP